MLLSAIGTLFMIKDKDGHPVKSVTITTSLRNEMIATIQRRIIHNLEAIKEVLKVQGYEDVGGALHLFIRGVWENPLSKGHQAYPSRQEESQV